MGGTTHIVEGDELVAVLEWAPGVRVSGQEFSSGYNTLTLLELTNWTQDDLIKAGLLIRREPTETEKEIRRHRAAIERLERNQATERVQRVLRKR